MSVITAHALKFENAKARLEAAGVCPPDVLHNSRGEARSFDHVLDFGRCNQEFAAEVRKHYEETGYRMWNEETQKHDKKGEYTQQELDELCKFPIQFEDDDTVLWLINYGSNDNPGVAISKLFPNDVMVYHESTEGHLKGSVYVKDGHDCTKDGRPIEGLIPCYSVTGIPGNNKQVRVSVPVDNTDKRFAFVYADKNNVQDANLLYGGKKKNLCVEHKDADVTVYRQLADGTKTKQTMTYGELREMVDKAREEYQNQPKKPRALPSVADKMESPQDEAQFGE